MKKEIKIGLLAVVTIAISVWGYTFLKGQNMLTRSYTFYAKFDNVDMLSASAPVLVSGYQVGTVTNLKLDPVDMRTIIVQLDIEKQFKVPKDTEVHLISTGIMGQKALELIMHKPCNGADCAVSGDFLKSKTVGLIESILGGENIDEVMSSVKTTMGDVFDTLNYKLSDPDNNGRISRIMRNIDLLTESLTKTSDNLNYLVNSTRGNFQQFSSSMALVAQNIEKNNQAIERILQNTATTTDKLSNTDIEGTVNSLKSGLESTEVTMKSFNQSLGQLDDVLKNLKTITGEMAAGKGNMGKLARDEELYENMTNVTKNLDLLLQDFRLNPKRYVNVSVFGKRQKKYQLPEEDPAFIDD
jgi:phospholipid/cholesterol/gamma-HCH transport system substrate-binding protein